MENRRRGAKKAAATRRAKRSMKDKCTPLHTMESGVISPSEVSDLWFSNTVCVCVCMYIIVEMVVMMCMYVVGCRVCLRRVQVLSVYGRLKICYSLFDAGEVWIWQL